MQCGRIVEKSYNQSRLSFWLVLVETMYSVLIVGKSKFCFWLIKFGKKGGTRKGEKSESMEEGK